MTFYQHYVYTVCFDLQPSTTTVGKCLKPKEQKEFGSFVQFVVVVTQLIVKISNLFKWLNRIIAQRQEQLNNSIFESSYDRYLCMSSNSIGFLSRSRKVQKQSPGDVLQSKCF